MVQAAFNFDDLTIDNIMVPFEKIIFLKNNMSFLEVKNICLKTFFSYYPVLDENNRIYGIFNFRKNYFEDNIENNWKEKIELNFLYFEATETLDKLLDVLNSDILSMAIVKKNKKLTGIITSKDVFYALLGKIKKTNIE